MATPLIKIVETGGKLARLLGVNLILLLGMTCREMLLAENHGAEILVKILYPKNVSHLFRKNLTDSFFYQAFFMWCKINDGSEVAPQ